MVNGLLKMYSLNRKRSVDKFSPTYQNHLVKIRGFIFPRGGIEEAI